MAAATLPFFNANICYSVEELKAYFSGQKAIDSIEQHSRNTIPSTSSKLQSCWTLLSWEIYAIFQEIYAIFLTAIQHLLDLCCATDLAKRCRVESRQAVATSVLLHHFYKMGDTFLMSSLNTHQVGTEDLYLHAPLQSDTNPLFEISKQYNPDTGIQFFHSRGLCRGMATWFFYLYFRTQSMFSNSDEHIKAITQQFQFGASHEAALLQSLNEQAPQHLLNLQAELEVAHLDPLQLSDHQMAEKLWNLPLGAYAIYTSTHRVNWIHLRNGCGYYFDPSFGTDKINNCTDLTKCVHELVKTHVVSTQMPKLIIDRISFQPDS